jgi:alkyl hydroperoxide reductase subunit AhpC
MKVQQPAPSFSTQALLPNGTFGTVSLDQFKGKYLVLFFYPLDFTFVCPTEIIAFSDRMSDFEKLGVSVVACSVDSVHSHLAWTSVPRNKGGLGTMKIPILSDITKSISKDYGVLIQDGEDSGIALRGTFVIDPKGTLRIAHVNDLPVGRSVDEILRVIEALQFHEAHGDVCPANWHKGDPTMKPDPVKSKDYFSKVSN